MSSKLKFDPRILMQMAVEVMLKSIHEPRNDSKPSPLVGAVLYKPDGTIETAFRGELRDGDHAEYTLLERKNRHSKLDGSKLFATLEPCAPDSRTYPKLACAQRIILARIKEVWIGVADPDPTVDGKGIKYLEESGVTVHMFDRDLQEIILKENKSFIDKALERAEDAVQKPKLNALTKFEQIVPTTALDDFSTESLERYRSIAHYEEAVDSDLFNRRLLRQGILRDEGGKLIPTGFGLLLFGKEPRDIMRQAGLLGTIHYPNGSEETRDFDGPMVLMPDLVEKWLNDKLPNTIDRSRMQRQQSRILPFELVREAVVNALVHRDYEIAGAKCQLVVTEDTITVKSPGGPLAPITLKQLQSFNAPMLSRNPELHYVFARMEMAEERGLGLKSLKTLPVKLGLPLPKYTFEDPYLLLTLYRTPDSAVRVLPPDLLNSLKSDELVGWGYISSSSILSMSEYAGLMGIDTRKAQRHLKHFVELGMLKRVGSGRSTQYQVAQS